MARAARFIRVHMPIFIAPEGDMLRCSGQSSGGVASHCAPNCFRRRNKGISLGRTWHGLVFGVMRDARHECTAIDLVLDLLDAKII